MNILTALVLLMAVVIFSIALYHGFKLTGLWRSAGTFAILVSLGLRSITPSMFVLAAFVPHCIACSVPLSMLNVGLGAMPYACYLYTIPIFCLTSSIISSKTAKLKVKGNKFLWQERRKSE